MHGIGQLLKQARIAQGITIEEAAETTKIRAKHLRAIEEEAFDILPGAVYAKGFASTYAKYLGIYETEEVSNILKNSVVVQPPQQESFEEQEKPQRRQKVAFEEVPLNKKWLLIIALSVVAILALLAIKWVDSANQPTEPDIAIPAITEEVEKESVVADPEPEKVYEGLELTITVFDLTPNAMDSSWMEIAADGKTLFSATMKEGEEQTVQAKETVKLRIGNAGAVRVTLNGEDLGTFGDKGKVVTKVFTLEDVMK